GADAGAGPITVPGALSKRATSALTAVNVSAPAQGRRRARSASAESASQGRPSVTAGRDAPQTQRPSGPATEPSIGRPATGAVRVDTPTPAAAEAPATVSTKGVPPSATLPPGASDRAGWPSARNTNGRLDALKRTQAPLFHSNTAARRGISRSPEGRSHCSSGAHRGSRVAARQTSASTRQSAG